MEHLTQLANELNPAVMTGIGLTALAINFLGTYEINKIREKDTIRAGFASAANVLFGSILLYAFVNNPLNAIPEFIGSFVGTALMVELSKHGKIKRA